MKLKLISVLGAGTLLLQSYSPTLYANISGVMGPNIDSNDRSIEFRTALVLADYSSQQDEWAYRLHYQHAFNDTFRGRIVMQYRDRGDFQYDFFRTELLYNFKKRAEGETYSSALRFDLRTRPEEFAVNWGNEWQLADGYRMRAILIVSKQFGGLRPLTGISVQTRASVSRKLVNGVRIGLQMLNQHGELGDFGSLDDSHGIYIGPSVAGKIGEFDYELRYLNGVTDAVRDHNFFFRLTTRL